MAISNGLQNSSLQAHHCFPVFGQTRHAPGYVLTTALTVLQRFCEPKKSTDTLIVSLYYSSRSFWKSILCWAHAWYIASLSILDPLVGFSVRFKKSRVHRVNDFSVGLHPQLCRNFEQCGVQVITLCFRTPGARIWSPCILPYVEACLDSPGTASASTWSHYLCKKQFCSAITAWYAASKTEASR